MSGSLNPWCTEHQIVGRVVPDVGLKGKGLSLIVSLDNAVPDILRGIIILLIFSSFI